MLKAKKNAVLLGLAPFVLLAGCMLISITVTVDEDFNFQGAGDFYYESVDVTENQDWIDHEDDIEFVELVTFNMVLTNNTSEAIAFEVYVDDFDEPLCTTRSCFDDAGTATRILKEITVPASSTRTITPGQSLAFVENLDEMKARALDGQFHIYGVATGGTSVNVSVEGTVFIILMVSGT